MKNKYVSSLQKEMFTKSDRCGPDDKANNEGYAHCTLQSVCVCRKETGFPRLGDGLWKGVEVTVCQSLWNGSVTGRQDGISRDKRGGQLVTKLLPGSNISSTSHSVN